VFRHAEPALPVSPEIRRRCNESPVTAETALGRSPSAVFRKVVRNRKTSNQTGYSGKFSGWKAYAHIEVGSMRMKTTPSPHSNGLEP
jgi:hypothetical protein